METPMSPAQLKRWFDSLEFEKKYHSDAPLGAWLDEYGTHLALCAPTSEQVVLNIYPDGDLSVAERSMFMRKAERGVWLHDESSRLDGAYYDFDVTVDGETSRTQDPYARACGVNGIRSMVVDLPSTNPVGWDEDHAPERARRT